jgi:hypothetical protein
MKTGKGHDENENVQKVKNYIFKINAPGMAGSLGSHSPEKDSDLYRTGRSRWSAAASSSHTPTIA